HRRAAKAALKSEALRGRGDSRREEIRRAQSRSSQRQGQLVNPHVDTGSEGLRRKHNNQPGHELGADASGRHRCSTSNSVRNHAEGTRNRGHTSNSISLEATGVPTACGGTDHNGKVIAGEPLSG